MHMKYASLLLALSLAPALAQEDFDSLMKRGDQLDAQLKTKEALAVYLEAEKLNPNNAELLHRIAKQYGESQNDVSSKEDKRSIGMKALDYARRAIAADPKNSMAQLAVAVSYGRVAPFLDNKTKIAYSKLVKEHAETARELDPKGNDLVYHVLGAWNYELANLNPVLRAVAQLIYGKLPSASNEAAAENFKKAQPKATMQTFEGYPESFLALQRGLIDAVVTDLIILANLRASAPNPEEYEIVTKGGWFGGGDYAIGVRENDSKWRDQINFILQDIWLDGTWDKIFDKWLGAQSKLKLTKQEVGFAMEVWNE